MQNTKPHQFLTSIDQSKYHNKKQCCSSRGMVEPSSREKQLFLMKNTKPDQFLTTIDQSKYHNSKQ
jgi:hypothetical protein